MAQQKHTTGAVISRLGVLTCLSRNLIPENHVEGEDRDAMLKEIVEIIDGQGGVGASKVIARSAERCAMARWN